MPLLLASQKQIPAATGRSTKMSDRQEVSSEQLEVTVEFLAFSDGAGEEGLGD